MKKMIERAKALKILCITKAKSHRKAVYNIVPVALCAVMFGLSNWQLSRAQEEIVTVEVTEDTEVAENTEEDTPAETPVEVTEEPEGQPVETLEAAEESEAASDIEEEPEFLNGGAYDDTEVENAEIVFNEGDVIEEHVSAYIPKATIKTVIGADGEFEYYTFFKRGRVLDYDVDRYIEEVDEIDFLYHLVEAESGNQCSLAKRLVTDCVLNQLASGKYADDLKSVILVDKNYEVVETGAVFCVAPQDSTRECVDNELISQVDYGVMYFRTSHYHTFGVPYAHVNDLWFSKPSADKSDQWQMEGTAEERGLITKNTEEEEEDE